MNEPKPLTPEQREELVSYLDQELDEDAARDLETKLSQSAASRQELESLKRTWDLLDFLPRPRASESFTHRTMERLETSRAAATRQGRAWRWAGRLSWAAAAAAAGVIGFCAIREPPRPPLPEPSAEDIRLLDHGEYWHYYDKIDSVEFLHELDRSGLFGEES